MRYPSPHPHRLSTWTNFFSGAVGPTTAPTPVLIGSIATPAFPCPINIRIDLHLLVGISDSGFWDFDVRWYPTGSGSFLSFGVSRCANTQNAALSNVTPQPIIGQGPGLVALYAALVSGAGTMTLLSDVRFNFVRVEITPQLTDAGAS